MLVSVFPMLVSVSGCSSPSTLFLVSNTCISSSSASFHRPWLLYVIARFPMVVSVSGCASPSTFFLAAITCNPSSSASFHRP
ncbi:unnamed protein product [Periconia digitata]|uniref:Uncharacterized protein n=1 Tax=Periconia digitata TaxID=1303443 RepID=A0A9W4XCR3_9PLEO|nr:unnamed protein product [Periconia digitata]